MVNSPESSAAPRRLCLEGDGGLALVADDYGPADGPPVLMLHGFGQTRRAWRETAVELAREGCRAVAPDARGHGESGHADDGDYRLDDFVDDARRFCRRLGQPVLVGASMGGLTGMLAEAENRHRLVAGLVLVDIAPRWEASGVERILAFMKARPGGFGSLEDAARSVAEYLPHREPRRTVEGLRPYLRETADGRLVWHWDPNLLSQFGAEPAPYHARLMAAARLLTCPTLLVNGELSEVVSDAAIHEFLQAVPHARQETIPGAAHMVAGDRNDAFTDAVRRFIAALNLPNDGPERGRHGAGAPWSGRRSA